MKFGLNFGVGSGKDSFVETNCYNPLVQLTDGGYGYDLAQVITGNLTPDTTANGILIYKASFYSTGEFYMSFGIAGQTKIFVDLEETNPVNQIIKEFESGHIELFWSTTNLRYEGNNLSLATTELAKLGNKVCFADIAIADLLIDIDFETIEVV